MAKRKKYKRTKKAGRRAVTTTYSTVAATYKPEEDEMPTKAQLKAAKAKANKKKKKTGMFGIIKWHTNRTNKMIKKI